MQAACKARTIIWYAPSIVPGRALSPSPGMQLASCHKSDIAVDPTDEGLVWRLGQRPGVGRMHEPSITRLLGEDKLITNFRTVIGILRQACTRVSDADPLRPMAQWRIPTRRRWTGWTHTGTHLRSNIARIQPNSDKHDVDPPDFGVELIDAQLRAGAFSPHRHDSYTVAATTAGVQSFNCRRKRWHSLAGQVVIQHPDEVHGG